MVQKRKNEENGRGHSPGGLASDAEKVGRGRYVLERKPDPKKPSPFGDTASPTSQASPSAEFWILEFRSPAHLWGRWFLLSPFISALYKAL